MQLKKLVVGMAVMTLFAAAQAYADDAAPTPDHPMHRMDADTNKDGKVSRDEFRAAQEKRSDEMFKRMDTNGDGFIDENERKAARDKMHERWEHRREMHEKAGADTPK